MYPGILVQMITTKQPTDDMIEVAIVAMEETLARRWRDGPAGRARPRAGPDARSGRDRGRGAGDDRSGGGRRSPGPRRDNDDGAARGRAKRRRRSRSTAARRLTRSSTGLDAKLAELALQYDEVHAELTTPDGPCRSRRQAHPRPRAGPA